MTISMTFSAGWLQDSIKQFEFVLLVSFDKNNSVFSYADSCWACVLHGHCTESQYSLPPLSEVQFQSLLPVPLCALVSFILSSLTLSVCLSFFLSLFLCSSWSIRNWTEGLKDARQMLKPWGIFLSLFLLSLRRQGCSSVAQAVPRLAWTLWSPSPSQLTGIIGLCDQTILSFFSFLKMEYWVFKLRLLN